MEPFIRAHWPPVDLEAGIDDDVLEQQSLRTTVALAKRMDDVEVAEVCGCRDDQLGAVRSFEPVGSQQMFEQFVRFGCNAARGAEASAALGYVYGTDLSSPVVNVAEQVTVQAFQAGQVVGGRFEVDGAGGDCGEVALRLGEAGCFIESQTIAQDSRAWQAVGVLAGPVPVQAQGWRFR